MSKTTIGAAQYLTKVLSLILCFDLIMLTSTLPDPNMTLISSECGEFYAGTRIWSTRIFVSKALPMIAVQGAKRFTPPQSTPYVGRVTSGDSRTKIHILYGTTSCYAHGESMQTQEQCRNCLLIIAQDLLLKCPFQKSGYKLVADCFITFTLTSNSDDSCPYLLPPPSP